MPDSNSGSRKGVQVRFLFRALKLEKALSHWTWSLFSSNRFFSFGYQIFKTLWRNSLYGSIPGAGVLKNALRRCCNEVYNVRRVGWLKYDSQRSAALCSSGIPCSVRFELLLINVQKLMCISAAHLCSVSRNWRWTANWKLMMHSVCRYCTKAPCCRQP